MAATGEAAAWNRYRRDEDTHCKNQIEGAEQHAFQPGGLAIEANQRVEARDQAEDHHLQR